MKLLMLATFLFFQATAQAQTIETNELVIHNAPSWLTSSRVQSVVDGVQTTMEWDIRKIQVTWYTDPAEFEKLHGTGASVLAFARRTDNTLHVGPRVDSSNFDGVFGHELVHIIVFQKYRNAIPGWLDEGLANYAAKRVSIDYNWLAREPYRDVSTLTHPFQGANTSGVTIPTSARYSYMASTSLMEMIAHHCDIHDLLQLSVGKKLETYLGTFCDISDVNTEFQKWIKSKAR